MDFNASWDSYKAGFSFENGNFWLGLDSIHNLTQWGSMDLYMEMYPVGSNTKYSIVYGGFSVGDESTNYTLSLGPKKWGNLEDYSSIHNGQMFSTADRDNDVDPFLNCASRYLGGWWMQSCYKFCLTCEDATVRNYVETESGAYFCDRIQMSIWPSQ